MPHPDGPVLSTPNASQTEVSVAYEYNPRDIITAAQWCLMHSNVGNALINRLIFVLAMLGSVTTIALAWWRLEIGIAILAFLILLTAVHGRDWLRRAIIKGLSRRISRESQTGQTSVQKQVVVNETEVVITSNNDQRKVFQWAELDGVEQTNEGVFFSQKQNLICFIPARAFGHPSTMNDFYERSKKASDSFSKVVPTPSSAERPPYEPAKATSIPRPLPMHPDYTQHSRVSRLAILSVISGIAGVLTLCFLITGFILGPLAFVTGIIAGRQIRRSPNTLTGKRLAFSGTVLGFSTFAVSLLLVTVVTTTSLTIPWLIHRIISPIVSSAMPAIKTSDQATSAMHAVAIVAGCKLYAAGHDGKFPPHFASLLIEKCCTPEQLLDPASSTSPISVTIVPKSEADWMLIAPAVDTASDFVYVGSDLRQIDSPEQSSLRSQLMVVYNHDLYDGAGRIVGFADGNARFIETKDLPAVFAACNGARAALKLRSISIDVPLTPAKAAGTTRAMGEK
jgi:hypothetical protein